MRLRRPIIAGSCAALLALVGGAVSTQMLAARFDHQPALGARVRLLTHAVYPPFAIADWSKHWSATYPRAFALPKLIFFAGWMGAGLILLIAFAPQRPDQRPFGAKSWGSAADARAVGLMAEGGIIIGKFAGELLAYDGPHHLLLTGGTRSGKTRGSVIPTLLASPHSILVLDLKGELHSGDARVDFPGTAGWRAQLGPVIRFAPAEALSDALNLFDTIRPGAQEVRDVQNLVELIADPYGDQRFQEFWDRAAKQILAGLILHVAYAEPPEKKTLARVFELLARFDDTVKLMEATLHRLNATTGEKETHPEVRRAAQSYAEYHDKLRAGIKATAESYLGLFADPLVRKNTATSTFRISDLMCADRPVTLYLCWPPNDAKRVKPLIRLVFGTVLRVLMEHQEYAADGRRKTRSLLLLLDEFPQLGKLDVFEQSMGAMAGYGLKAYLVTQSLHQVTQAYGRYHTILDNCQIVTSFAATDVETAETISKLAGDIFEMRPQETWSGKRQLFGLDHRAITYREERRPLLLPSEVRSLHEREELIFVTGARPLRARKVRYDEEPIFRQRLISLPPPETRAALPSPWAGHSSLLGVVVKTPASAKTGREGAAERVVAEHTPLRSRPPRPPSPAQPDLLALIGSPPSDTDGEALAQANVDASTPAPPPPQASPAGPRFDLRPRGPSPDGRALS
ncbi:MAG: type IV secretory system conjugative DNA transfer family protein [Hyphomonadaceae bacterium]|nr:type IV secretory system conjugative DNA transfer family protein [Hyphomonadaceae bacterium]